MRSGEEPRSPLTISYGYRASARALRPKDRASNERSVCPRRILLAAELSIQSQLGDRMMAGPGRAWLVVEGEN